MHSLNKGLQTNRTGIDITPHIIGIDDMNMYVVLLDEQLLSLNNAGIRLVVFQFHTVDEALSSWVVDINEVSTRENKIWAPDADSAITHYKRKARMMKGVN